MVSWLVMRPRLATSASASENPDQHADHDRPGDDAHWIAPRHALKLAGDRLCPVGGSSVGAGAPGGGGAGAAGGEGPGDIADPLGGSRSGMACGIDGLTARLRRE